MKLQKQTAHLDEPTPNNHLMVAGGNKHSSAFSFFEFLEIQLKFVIHWMETRLY